MNHLQIINQNEFEVEDVHMSFSLNSYNLVSYENERETLNEFINPEIFKHKDFHKVIRDSQDSSQFLNHSFNLEKIDAEDFKILSKHEVKVFFKNNISPYVEIDNDDKKESVVKAVSFLTNKFSEIIEKYNSENFYVLNIDSYDSSWNENGNSIDVKLTSHANIYSVYFLIIWIDYDGKKLLVCQSLWD